MSASSLLYLSRSDIEAIDLSISEMITSVERVFVEKGMGRIEMPPKPGIHTQPNAFIHAMPAYIPELKSAGLKWVSGYPENEQKGLPYISGLLILNDPETGIPMAVMDCTWITAKRTGAATAVAAKYLARKDSSQIGIIACGVQGRSNLEALNVLFNIIKVKAFDIIPERARQYADEMGRIIDVEIEPVSNVKAAIEDMDIVVTSGPILQDPQPLIEPGWLPPGSFACPLDFDSYWQGKAFSESDKLVTDDLAQLFYYRKIGYFKSTPEPCADLGQIAAGQKPGRESDDEKNICINLGLAIEDMAVAIELYNRAKENGFGTELPL